MEGEDGMKLRSGRRASSSQSPLKSKISRRASAERPPPPPQSFSSSTFFSTNPSLGPLSPPPKSLGLAVLAVGAVVTFAKFTLQRYVPFQPTRAWCIQGLATVDTWCSFDRPNGYQIAQSCACIKSCAEDHFSLCRVNTTSHGLQDFRAMLHDDETVYLDIHHPIDDPVRFLVEEGLM